MNAIKATWTNGQIVLTEPARWPEGSELVVEPIARNGGKIGLTEDEWRDDSESIVAWVDAVEQLEPLIWADVELEEFERYRATQRQFNIDAVRKQMDEMPPRDVP